MTKPNVLVIDAGLGNIGSVIAAFQRQNCEVQRLQQPPKPEETKTITHAVLPGVGAFATGMQALRHYGWEKWIKETWCKPDRPLLGICLGMQLLSSLGTEGSSDGNIINGLDLIPGKVDRLNVNTKVVLPHVGWNEVEWNDKANPLAQGLPTNSDMYFVHSYVFHTKDSKHRLAETDYSQRFTAVVGKGLCYGVQFHPEKSQRLGRQLIENFLALGKC